MELNQIRYFLSLAETLNFTQAARLTGISQPSLTKSMRRLEEELGAPLLYRDGKDTRLTALGREMQTVFMRIDMSVADAYEAADLTIAGRSRTLSIGVAQTISPAALSGFIGHVLDQLPSVELEIHQMQKGENEAEVLSGKYDLCILTAPPTQNIKLAIVPLFTEAVKIAMAKSHDLAGQTSLTPKEIMQEVYIDRLHCEFRSQLIEHFMDSNIVMRPRLQSEREDWVQQMVTSGLGICALPERSGVAQDLVLRPVEGLSLSRVVTMVSVSGSGTPKEVRQIIDLAREYNWAV